jgi:hypothetical protein
MMGRWFGGLAAWALALTLVCVPAWAQWQNWSAGERQQFYTLDQGSRLIPFAWFAALPKPDGSGRLAADGLARFGYLPNPGNPPERPVGFTEGDGELGMTCAACHTREIVVAGGGAPVRMRIDGGPAIVDFHAFLSELNASVGAILRPGADFSGFAKIALERMGRSNSTANVAKLKGEVEAWHKRFGPYIRGSLPEASWGPSRLDAFGMIFNRVAGYDLDIEGNYRKADAPVRYPFLWDAPRQNKTQWNGAAPNGLYIHGMARNAGEVMGVFARLEPKRIGFHVDLDGSNNSIQFKKLQQIEELVRKLGRPAYPLPVDTARASAGEGIFRRECASCHGVSPRIFPPESWETPVRAAGTDTRMFDNSLGKRATSVQTGKLRGMPLVTRFGFLGSTASPIDLLAAVVGNTLLQEVLTPFGGVGDALEADLRLYANADRFGFLQQSLKDIYAPPPEAAAGPAYEARVLTGIWSAAPYLHNGSVPNLWALLQPVEARPKRFFLGSNQFDPICVGLTADADGDAVCTKTTASTSPLRWEFKVPDGACPSDNGNGNCGHLWGVGLTPEEKWSLIEYLKTL